MADARGPPWHDRPMTKAVEVRRLVMFKHGVAYVERAGRADGDFELSFDRDEMNDVLKSLSVWVASGEGRVRAVAFDAPEDPREALKKRNLDFEPGQVGRGLVEALRGRSVEVLDVAGNLRGEVLGFDESQAAHGARRRQLVLRGADDHIVLVDLAEVKRIAVLEAPSRADLELLVDRTRAASAGTSKLVKVGLDGSAEDLRVSYVVPAPVWRVSYRLVHEDARSLLFAWGIVHNPLDEDVNDVELTLTTGQPVSFVIDLYHQKRVQRAVVEETSRAVAKPRAFERAHAPPPGPPGAYAAPAPAMAPFGGPPQPAAMAMLEDSFAPAADTAERGELFEYRIRTPVSLKRGGSAMVPLARVDLRAEKQRIWRDGAGPNPDLVLSFDNATGLVLEEGPAVIYDEGGYAGEAMLPYSARGAAVKVGFAKDLAVRCQQTLTTSRKFAGVRLGQDAIIEELRDHYEHSIRGDSDHEQPVRVLVELPRQQDAALAGSGAEPLEETANMRRFALDLPARGHATIEVRTVRRAYQRVDYSRLSASLLQQYLADRYLDDATIQTLRSVLEAREAASDCDRAVGLLEAEKKESFERQKHFTEQLGVLRDGGSEGELRQRFVGDLGGEQDRVRDLDDRMRKLRDEARRLRDEAERRLAELTGAPPR
jgi:hypothetical protein